MPSNLNISIYSAWGLDFYNPSWILEYSKDNFVFSYIKNDLVAQIKLFQKKHDIKFDGIVTWLDTSVHFVNEAAHELGLPVISRLRGKKIKNKFYVRQILNLQKIDSSFWFRLLRNVDDLETMILNESIPFPIIAKPTEMMASLGVIKINSIKELREWFPLILNVDFEGENLREQYGDIEQTVLLEEFISGDEYSVETVVNDKKCNILGITKKYTSQGTYWDELGHTFPAQDLSKEEEEAIFHFIKLSHQALEFENTITHTELKMQKHDDKRVPRLIEINPRLAGDYIYYLIEQSLGESIGEIMALTSMAESNTIIKNYKKNNSFSVNFITTSEHGRILKIPADSHNKNSNIKLINLVDQDEIIHKLKEAFGNRLGAIIASTTELSPEIKNYFQYEIEEPILYRNIGNTEIATFKARASDIQKMFEAEKLTWDETLAANIETITQRMIKNPEGAIVCFDLKTKKLLGFFSTIKIGNNELSYPLRWEEGTMKALKSFHERNGLLDSDFKLIGISLTVIPDAPRGTGRLLMESAVKLATLLEAKSLENVVRIPHFKKWKNEKVSGIDEYLEQLKSGAIIEPTVQIAILPGVYLTETIENYYDDSDSINNGIHFIHKLNKKK